MTNNQQQESSKVRRIPLNSLMDEIVRERIGWRYRIETDLQVDVFRRLSYSKQVVRNIENERTLRAGNVMTDRALVMPRLKEPVFDFR